MDDIRDLLSRASRRLLLDEFLRRLVSIGGAVAIALIGLVLVEKLGPWSLRWPVVLGSAAGLTLAGSAASAWARRLTGLKLADEVDRRAGLNETLSTTISLAAGPMSEARSDGWSAAVIQTASERARRVVLPDAVPVRAPRGWAWPVAMLAAAAAGLWLAPRHDLTGLLARDEAERAEQAEVVATALEIRGAEDRLREILEQTSVDLEEDPEATDEPATGEKPETAEELKRSALKKLTTLNDELTRATQSESARSLDAIEQSVRQLKDPGPGPAEEFARSLARGEFAQAGQALERLASQVESGAMSAEEKAQAAAQLEALAEQMERLAASLDEAKTALEAAGLSPEQAEKLAGDPSALKEALDQMSALSPEQRQSLLDMAQSQSAAGEAMQSMAQSLGQMAQAMQSGQAGTQAMKDLSQQLTQCEMAASEMQALRQAMSECQGQMQALGQSLCEGQGSGHGQSLAMGGVGGGIGAADAENEVDPDAPLGEDFMLRTEKTSVPNMGGPVIGSTLVYGSQVRGEAVARFGEVAQASAVEAAEAIDSMRVPREYHDAVRHYFGRLEAAAKRTDKPKE